MAALLQQQYAFRAQKQLGLVGGTPDYEPHPTFEKPVEFSRTYQHSADGKLFAFALPTVVRVIVANTAELVRDIPVPAIEINFSPRGTFLSTWERLAKNEDGSQHKNMRVWDLATGEEVAAFTQKSQEGWDLQYTPSESHAVRLSGSEIQVFQPSSWAKGVVDKLRVEGVSSIVLSPGLNPSIAVFVAEKKGAPATIRIFGLLTLNSPPTCQKSFYKADRSQIKWNALGTQVLVLTQTEVDKTGKSYYGETGLYLLSAVGNFDCRVTLDKEGPIHDFTWSPNSKEFGVVYGYMPAKTMLFDQRVRTLFDFGASPHNFISFNPQGRLLALGGFGNLAGKIDVYDRRTLSKVCTIDAPNTSHCEWSEEGRFILTATLSPRLRVDNGIKIWHCTGPLVHVQAVDDLYQASWKPAPIESAPPFGQNLPPAPAPSASARAVPTPPPTAKPAGAYRPPGALGRAAPSIFKREDEGGTAFASPRSGSSTPPRFPAGRAPTPLNGAAVNGNLSPEAKNGTNGGHPRKRHVPGAMPSPPAGGNSESDKKVRKKRDRKGEGGEPERPRTAGREEGGRPHRGGERSGTASAGPGVATGGVKHPNGLLHVPVAGSLHTTLVDENSPASPGAEGGLDPVQKKIRNLTKKLKAIEELKEKAKRGEKLEATQLKKMDGEQEIRKELTAANKLAASGGAGFA